MVSRFLGIGAAVAAGLLLATLVSAYNRPQDPDPLEVRVQRPIELEPPAIVRCSIYHARFGGNRAELIKEMRGDLPSYVVVEAGRRDPLLRRQRVTWLRGMFGDGEQTWLGEFSSPESAMTQASRLCPPALRCWPGDEGCGLQSDPPGKAFMQL